jgi:hypothetical protein
VFAGYVAILIIRATAAYLERLLAAVEADAIAFGSCHGRPHTLRVAPDNVNRANVVVLAAARPHIAGHVAGQPLT